MIACLQYPAACAHGRCCCPARVQSASTCRQDSEWFPRLQGEIPDEWGESGSFPILRNLSLSFNSLTGDLPADWGSDASSLQNLTHLNISNCGLNSTLPKDWARNLPSLVSLNLSANTLSGDPQVPTRTPD